MQRSDTKLGSTGSISRRNRSATSAVQHRRRARLALQTCKGLYPKHSSTLHVLHQQPFLNVWGQHNSADLICSYAAGI